MAKYISDLEEQFLKDIFEASHNQDIGETLPVQIGAIIEDIWDAPESWPEYDEFFGKDRNADEVRRELINILPNWNINLEDWMKPYLKTPINKG